MQYWDNHRIWQVYVKIWSLAACLLWGLGGWLAEANAMLGFNAKIVTLMLTKYTWNVFVALKSCLLETLGKKVASFGDLKI